jgi:tetratricopeptide (TPR) repeat protein
MPVSRSFSADGEPPDPGRAATLAELVEALRQLKTSAGDPSYDTITRRVNAAWTAAGRPIGELAKKPTVADCFKPGRRRLNADLVTAVVAALHPDTGYVAQWPQALQVIAGQARAAAQVRVQDRLPPDLAEFTGRTAELAQLRHSLHDSAADGAAVVVSAIAGMAGVGKTRLAVHAGHLLASEGLFAQVLFVNLRGFHPEPGQPPADPAAVLDGFLRLLGVPGQQIPHDLPARIAAYRDRLAGTRTLIVLDNAADAEQTRPLLPVTPGCPVIVTSRRDLTALRPSTHLAIDVFGRDEALRFLTAAAPESALGPDPHARVRIAARCGHLPLALGLVAAHIQARPGWTLTDHADRLDDHHQHGRVDTGVQLALDLSYRHLPADRQRLLRLVALHPGQDFDAYAAAALAGTGLAAARAALDRLCQDHMLQRAAPGRYTLHDLVRAYAAARAGDDDPPPERRAALTRLLDHYLHTAATAMDAVHPAERHNRPRITPAATGTPALADAAAALEWLDAERADLAAVALYAADHGWPGHTIRLAATLHRYLHLGGHSQTATALHTRARNAALATGDRHAEAQALNNLGTIYLYSNKYQQASDHFDQALTRCRAIDDRTGEAQAVTGLGGVQWRTGRYRQAADYYQRADALCRAIGDRNGEARALNNLGCVHERLGHYDRAGDDYHRAAALSRTIGDGNVEARALNNLGGLHRRLGHYQHAADYYQQALIRCRAIGDRYCEAMVLAELGGVRYRLGHRRQGTDHLRHALDRFREIGDRQSEARVLTEFGIVHQLSGDHEQAAGHHRQALARYREIGDRGGETTALNLLGEALSAAGRPDQARPLHATALTNATDIADRYEQARAHHGLAHTTGHPEDARHHWRQALAIYSELGIPETERPHATVEGLDER